VIFGNLDPVWITGVALALVIGITCHEFSHAAVAEAFGDNRPRAMGRVSLNPLRHIEPLGAIFFVIAGFGWGRPVSVNVYGLRGGRRSMAWVSAAGPATNLVVAVAFAVLYRVFALVGDPYGWLGEVLAVIVLMNVVLAFFNFIPIPPLDGYNFALAFLPVQQVFAVQRYAQYGLFVLLLLILLGSSGPLGVLFGAAADLANLLMGGRVFA
jgi:Zn-dependent protease